MFLNLKVDLNGKLEEEGEEKGNENISKRGLCCEHQIPGSRACSPLPSFFFRLSFRMKVKSFCFLIFLVFSPGSGLFMA